MTIPEYVKQRQRKQKQATESALPDHRRDGVCGSCLFFSGCVKDVFVIHPRPITLPCETDSPAYESYTFEPYDIVYKRSRGLPDYITKTIGEEFILLLG